MNRELSGTMLRSADVGEFCNPALEVIEHDAGTSWSASPEMSSIQWVIERVADSDVTVLIRGESGVGKELVAHAIHRRSAKRDRPCVKVNCAALPAELLESELFGHEKGAFTGAVATRLGKFEQANSGTIFLDEIGELTAPLQAKLLHVLQDSYFTKLGSNKPVGVDVRIVAATNRNLEDMMLNGEFREDLYYRLKVIEIVVPPLRERRAEILGLCQQFIIRYAREYNRPRRELSKELQLMFQHYDWPGNIRELENMIKRIVILQDEQAVLREIARARRVPAGPPAAPAPGPRRTFGARATMAQADERAPRGAADQIPPVRSRLADVGKAAALEAERSLIEETLRQFRWNRKRAAEELDVSYKTLLNRIKECGLQRR